MKPFTVNIESSTGTIYFTYNLNLKQKYIFSVCDFGIDCVYYNCEFDLSSQGSGFWIIPMSQRLIQFATKNENFYGFVVKIYTSDKVLIQSEELVLHKNASILPYPLYFDQFDTNAASYIEFFHGDICDGMDMSGTIVDAGANVGFFSLYAKHHGANKIYILDPDPMAFYSLKKNLKKYPEVTLIHKALSHDANDITMNIKRGGTVGTSEFPSEVDIFSIQMPSISVDSILSIEENINLLKIDIEGTEFRVIENFNTRHFEKINQLFIEFHFSPKSIAEKLKNLGYNVEYRYSTENDSVGFIYAKK